MQSLHLHELDGMAPLLVCVLPEHVGQVGQVGVIQSPVFPAQPAGDGDSLHEIGA